jgi:DNA-binding winged helix-turn-helix (wHTH) protein
MDYVIGAYRLDTQRYELTYAGVPIPLRPKVFQVLAYLLAHHDRVVSKEELLTQLWPGQFVGDVGLNSYIMEVRKALGDRRPPYQYIRTVRGYGYRFVAEVTTEDQTPPARPAPLARASTDGGPEMDVRVEEASLQRGPPASTGEWKLVTVLCCALADPPAGTSLALETHYRQLSALYALVRDRGTAVWGNPPAISRGTDPGHLWSAPGPGGACAVRRADGSRAAATGPRG